MEPFKAVSTLVIGSILPFCAFFHVCLRAATINSLWSYQKLVYKSWLGKMPTIMTYWFKAQVILTFKHKIK